MFVHCYVIQYFVSFWFCNDLDGEERAGCFTLSYSQCSVLPHGAMGKSSVRDCGISCS